MQAVAKVRKLDVIDIDPNAVATIEVIGAGLPRCATSSLHFAFEDKTSLDFGPALHMKRIMPNAERSRLALAAMKETDREKRQKLIRELCEGCRSCIDWPMPFFVDDLMDIYPDAKIVLNHRPGAQETKGTAWARSCKGAFSFYDRTTFFWLCVMFKSMRNLYWMSAGSHDAFARNTGLLRAGEGFGLDWFDPEFYTKYYEHVRREASGRNREILEWEPSDGWEPLCKFLGREVPADGRPFPHINDAAEMDGLRRTIKIVGAGSWIALGAVGFAAWKFGPWLLSAVRR